MVRWLGSSPVHVIRCELRRKNAGVSWGGNRKLRRSFDPSGIGSRRRRRDSASALLVWVIVADALVVEVAAQPIPLGARPDAIGFVAAESHAVLGRLLRLFGAVALLAILVEVDDVAHGHRLPLAAIRLMRSCKSLAVRCVDTINGNSRGAIAAARSARRGSPLETRVP